MTLANLQQQRIAIIGFGKEGQAVLNYLAKHNLSAVVFDRQAKEKLDSQTNQLLSDLNTEYYGGSDYLEKALDSVDIWFKSPGVLLPKVILQKLHDHEISLTSQTAWFFEHCPAKIIGVTGTKGKGTTSSLIHLLLTKAGMQSYLTGNIGLVSPLEILDQISSDDYIVFELSSFQLEYLKQSPHIGVCLMVTNDHFDYHESQQEYWQAKTAIAKYQNANDFIIYNADYPATKKIVEDSQGQKIIISKSADSKPQVLIKEAEERLEVTISESTEINTTNRKLLGKHNLENIAAAVAVGVLLKIDSEIIESAINEFAGLPHRLQKIAEYKGVTFIDDSIATNPDTTIAAMNAINNPVILLLGGADKNLNYTSLLNYLGSAEKLKQVVLIGEVGKKLHNNISDSLGNKVIGPFSDFELAMQEVFKLAQSGDVVLLSPAATSFDMFNNYSERGDRFAQLIKEHYGK